MSFSLMKPSLTEPEPRFAYPTPEMEKALLENRFPVPGHPTAFVMVDRPKDTYYVAVVAQRLEKNDADFSRSVYSETGVSGARAAVTTEASRPTTRS